MGMCVKHLLFRMGQCSGSSCAIFITIMVNDIFNLYVQLFLVFSALKQGHLKIAYFLIVERHCLSHFTHVFWHFDTLFLLGFQLLETSHCTFVLDITDVGKRRERCTFLRDSIMCFKRETWPSFFSTKLCKICILLLFCALSSQLSVIVKKLNFTSVILYRFVILLVLSLNRCD